MITGPYLRSLSSKTAYYDDELIFSVFLREPFEGYIHSNILFSIFVLLCWYNNGDVVNSPSVSVGGMLTTVHVCIFCMCVL